MLARSQEVIDNLRKIAFENKAVVSAGVVTAASIAALSYRMSQKNQPLEPLVDLNNQSIIIDGKPWHRASCLAKAPDYMSYDRFAPECQTVYDALLRGRKLSNNGPCMGERTGPNKEYKWITYQEVLDRVHRVGSGLLQKGLTAANDTKVGIYAANRPEWHFVDFGCQAYTMCPVPLYDTLGTDSIKYVINQCEMTVVVTDSLDKVQKLIDHKSELPTLKLVVVVDQYTPELAATANQKGIELMQFADLEALGKEHYREPIKPKPEDVFSICYTSGTTGNPKGAMLTHHSFILMIDSMAVHAKKHYEYTPEDTHLSYLPLAHNFDRAVCVMMFMSGARVGYFSRNPALILNDLAALKPTVFPSVPRLFNRIYDTVMADVRQSKIKSTLLKWAMESKMKEVNRLVIRRDSFWDKILFKKIQNILGGRVRLLVTGSAPLSSEVMQFLKAAFGCPIMEGYGQTEAGAGVTISMIGDTDNSGVGPPLPCVHVKLTDVPELDYYSKDNYGEVCVKGGIVMKGYYKLPDKTAEALDNDGWLHTGDIGTWLPNGTLKIVDRIKHIFKLSQGEYIAPEKIENVYRSSPYIAQCFVDGNSLKSHIVAVVVPDADYLAKWAPNNGFPSDLEKFCQRQDAHDLILKDMLEIGKKAGLKGFEQVKDMVLEPKLFSIENGMLTPTLKNKRPALRKIFKDKIDELYAKNGL